MNAIDRLARKRHAIQDVKDKYRPRFAKLQEQMQAEIDAIEADFYRQEGEALAKVAA